MTSTENYRNMEWFFEEFRIIKCMVHIAEKYLDK